MKKDTHPKYQKVLFIDSASGSKFICGSTLQPKATQVFEGVEYPVSYLSISSASHPFFTGSKQLVDSEGRVEKFKKRFGTRKEITPIAQGDSDQEQQRQQEFKPPVEDKKASAKKPAQPQKKGGGKPAANTSKPAAKGAKK